MPIGNNATDQQATAACTTRTFAYTLAITRTSAGLKDFLTSTLGLLILPLLRVFIREVSQELLHYCRNDCTRPNILPFCSTRVKQPLWTQQWLSDGGCRFPLITSKHGVWLWQVYATHVIVKCDAAKSIVRHRHHKSPRLNPNSKKVSPYQGIFYVNNPHYTVINLMDAIPLCDITKAYTDIYFNT